MSIIPVNRDRFLRNFEQYFIKNLYEHMLGNRLMTVGCALGSSFRRTYARVVSEGHMRGMLAKAR